MNRPSIVLPWLAALLPIFGGFAAAESIAYPTSAGVIDVTRPPYGAKADGVADDTAAIQKALDDHPARGATIYLPDGTYLISDTLRWGAGTHDHEKQRLTVLQGQSRDKTVIKLADRCPGFGDPVHPRAMVWTGGAPAQRFRNQIRNCTWDAGVGNVGAIGVQFNASNVGCLRDVRIRAGGPAAIGLDQSFADDFGPCFVKNLTVEGFTVGIAVKHGINGVVYENVALEGQSEAGVRNEGMPVTFRNLSYKGPGAAIVNAEWTGLVTLVGAKFTRTSKEGDASAIRLDRGGMYARDLETAGYAHAITSLGQDGRAGPVHVPGGVVPEWASHRLPGSAPTSLHLPVKETPDVPWDDPKDWAVVTDFGAKMDDDSDDSHAVQEALDSGKTTVCLPRGKLVLGKPVTIPGTVRRLIGAETAVILAESLRGQGPAFVVAEGREPVLVVERFSTFFWDNRAGAPYIANPTGRTLVLRELGDVDDTTDQQPNGAGTVVTGPGEWFIEDVTGRFHLMPGSKVWARYLNPETNQDGRNTRREAQWHMINEGGTLWVLGIKTEGPGPVVWTKAGGETEILGGLMYSSGGARTQDRPAFEVDDARASVVISEANFGNNPYRSLVRVTSGGRTTFELKSGQAAGAPGGSMIPLWATK